MPEIKTDKHQEEINRLKVSALNKEYNAFWKGIKIGGGITVIVLVASLYLVNHFAGSRLVWALTNEKKMNYAIEADKMMAEKQTRSFGEAMVLLNGLDK